jgi:hypothetical protein
LGRGHAARGCARFFEKESDDEGGAGHSKEAGQHWWHFLFAHLDLLLLFDAPLGVLVSGLLGVASVMLLSLSVEVHAKPSPTRAFCADSICDG